VTQTGCDTHHDDPLTDLNATLALYPRLAQRLHYLAHDVCAGRWIILGGGGYDPADVTPRAWAAFIGTVLGHDPTRVPLPAAWLDESRARGGNPPDFLSDDTPVAAPVISERDITDLLEQIEHTALASLRERMAQGH
jgi:acetoin utilization protein AcuC